MYGKSVQDSNQLLLRIVTITSTYLCRLHILIKYKYFIDTCIFIVHIILYQMGQKYKNYHLTKIVFSPTKIL